MTNEDEVPTRSPLETARSPLETALETVTAGERICAARGGAVSGASAAPVLLDTGARYGALFVAAAAGAVAGAVAGVSAARAPAAACVASTASPASKPHSASSASELGYE